MNAAQTLGTDEKSMTALSSNPGRITLASRVILLVGTMILIVGCGAVPIRHVPKVASSSKNMSDLHGAQPIELKAGAANATEEAIGSVGMGKVMGNLSEWTTATVEAVRANLSARGAKITAGAPKVLTITMTKAEVKAIPVVGVSKCKIVLTATTPEGLNSTFEGDDSSMAPLSAVDGAVADAVKKLLTDSAVETYLRK